jgi:hypothetical protein
MVNFQDVFGKTKPDDLIVLSEVEIDNIGKAVKTKLKMENALNLTVR